MCTSPYVYVSNTVHDTPSVGRLCTSKVSFMELFHQKKKLRVMAFSYSFNHRYNYRSYLSIYTALVKRNHSGDYGSTYSRASKKLAISLKFLLHMLKYKVSQLVNSFECLLPHTVLNIKLFLQIIYFKKTFN